MLTFVGLISVALASAIPRPRDTSDSSDDCYTCGLIQLSDLESIPSISIDSVPHPSIKAIPVPPPPPPKPLSLATPAVDADAAADAVVNQSNECGNNVQVYCCNSSGDGSYTSCVAMGEWS